MIPRLAIAVTAAVILAPSIDAQEIDTRSGTPDYPCCAEGIEVGRTAGQTFRLPNGTLTQLNWFSFFSSSTNSGSDQFFHAYLYEWNSSTSRITGPQLYRSDVRAPIVTSSSGGAEMRFDVGVILDPSKVYIAFLSMLEVGATGDGKSNFVHHDNAYNDGQMFFTTASSLNAAASQSWFSIATLDYSFVADFDTPTTVTPEPASMMLLGTGLSSIAGIAARRRRKKLT